MIAVQFDWSAHQSKRSPRPATRLCRARELRVSEICSRRPHGARKIDLYRAFGTNGLLRECEKATPNRRAACEAFWLAGTNRAGRGAIAGWRDLLAPNLNHVALWPFDGALPELLASGNRWWQSLTRPRRTSGSGSSPASGS